MNSKFFSGVLKGIPIALGYLFVSFGFGIASVRAGLSVFQSAVISATNLTSAGQAAGVAVIASGGGYAEIALTEFVINLRYSLMSVSLSQRLDESAGTAKRLAAACGITDEIFAAASGEKPPLAPAFIYGMTLIATLGWVGGTVLGAAAGSALDERLTAAMGIMLYAMFIAVFVPAAKREKSVLFACAASVALSTVMYYLAAEISSGFAVIICSVASAAAAALLFPTEQQVEEADG